MVEAYIFMKGEPDVIQSYNEQFQIAMGLIKWKAMDIIEQMPIKLDKKELRLVNV
ncbi:MAG: hypothetical protein CM15mV96_450 [uncultured marine virus]|nr:MAG: hypothetical protein CM15mV96_450 [uncultured marine virus]